MKKTKVKIQNLKLLMEVFIVVVLIGALITFCSTYVKPNYTLGTIINPTSTPIPTITPTIIPTKAPIVLPTIAPVSSKGMMLPTKATGEFKAFMDKSKITRRSSAQWKLKQLYWTDSQGFCRFNEFYVVAMGTFYATHIGDILEITLTSRTFTVIIGDVKKGKDTVNNQYCRTNGSMIEFIVERKKLNPDIALNGNLSKLGFEGKVLKIEKLFSKSA